MKNILIGCFLATLLILVPITTATVPNNPEAQTDEEPKNSQIRFTGKTTPSLDPWYDEDGPYEGGLDDPSDWTNLIYGIGMSMFIVGLIIGSDFTGISTFQDLLSFIGSIVIILI